MKAAAFLIMCFLFFSCSKESATNFPSKPESCDSLRYTYNDHIKPILNANCNFPACHAPRGSANYDYTEYIYVVNQVRSGAIEYRIELPLSDPQHMPEKFNLSSCDYYQIKMWILQGYPEK